MTCQSNQHEFLDGTWTYEELLRAGELLEHVNGCAVCRDAIGDYDQLRSLLASSALGQGDDPKDGELAVSAPVEGWKHFACGLEQVIDRPEDRRGNGWTLRFVALAALMVFAVSGWLLAWQRGGPPPARTGATVMTATGGRRHPPQEDHLLPQQLLQQVEVFRNVSEVLEQRPGWLAQGEKLFEVGLASESVQPQQRILALRLTILRAQKELSQTDLLIVAGQTAELKVPISPHQLIHYRIETTARQPTLLVISMQLQQSNGSDQQIAALATRLAAQPGRVVPAGQFATTSGVYELKIGFAEATFRRMGT